MNVPSVEEEHLNATTQLLVETKKSLARMSALNPRATINPRATLDPRMTAA